MPQRMGRSNGCVSAAALSEGSPITTSAAKGAMTSAAKTLDAEATTANEMRHRAAIEEDGESEESGWVGG